jgi:putative addiction module component (TIGR02574 family)
MTSTAQKVLEEAMRLEPKERAELAGRLLESLEPESEEGVAEAWLTEIERRMAELDSGSAQSVPWEQVRARLYGSDAASRR